MKLTKDELISLIVEVTELRGDALAEHGKLIAAVADNGVEIQQKKIFSLQSKISKERAKLAKLKYAARRKRQLEKSNEQRRRSIVKTPLSEIIGPIKQPAF